MRLNLFDGYGVPDAQNNISENTTACQKTIGNVFGNGVVFYPLGPL